MSENTKGRGEQEDDVIRNPCEYSEIRNFQRFHMRGVLQRERERLLEVESYIRAARSAVLVCLHVTQSSIAQIRITFLSKNVLYTIIVHLTFCHTLYHLKIDRKRLPKI